MITIGSQLVGCSLMPHQGAIIKEKLLVSRVNEVCVVLHNLPNKYFAIAKTQKVDRIKPH